MKISAKKISLFARKLTVLGLIVQFVTILMAYNAANSGFFEVINEAIKYFILALIFTFVAAILESVSYFRWDKEG